MHGLVTSLTRRGAVVLVLLATSGLFVSAAWSQAVLWQTEVESRWGSSGSVVAYVAPGHAYAAGTRFGLFGLELRAWVARVDMSGGLLESLDVGGELPNVGLPLQVVPADVGAGPDDAFVAGSLLSCNVFLPPPSGCTVEYHWLDRYVPGAGRTWRAIAEVSAAVAVDDAGVYVVGREGEPRAQKFDRTGALQWTRTLAQSGGEGFKDVAIHPAGGIVAAGSASSGPVLQRFDSLGNALWPSALVSGLDPTVRLQRVVVDAEGSVLVAGLRPNAGRPSDIAIVKVAADGAVQWIRARPGVLPSRHPQLDQEVHRLAVDRLGRAVIAATATTPLDVVAWTAAYDAAGNLAWSDEYVHDPAAFAFGGPLVIDARNHVYVGGSSIAATAAVVGFVRKLGPDGSAMWTIQPRGPIKDMTLGTSGELLVLADLDVLSDRHAALMRIDPGAAAGAPPPQVQLVLPPAPISGTPLTLAVVVQGASLPTGVATFRIDGNVACAVAALQPLAATSARAECHLGDGLPPGNVFVDVTYAGDMNNGAAVASGVVVVAGAIPAQIPALTPLGLALLAVALAAMAAVRRGGHPGG